jgi:hypothetical protein
MLKKIALGSLLLALAASACGCGGGEYANTSNANTSYNRNANVNANANTSANANASNRGDSNASNASNTSGNLNQNRAVARNNNTAASVENSVDAYLASLPIGEVAFNTPERMRLGETANIEVKLGGPQLAGSLGERITEPGKVEALPLKIGAVMEAQLAGSNFQITPLTPAEQPVTAGDPTEWEWQIKPTAEGRQRLNLTLSVVVAVDGRERRRKAETFKRDISVEVDAGSRIGQLLYENLALIVTVVVVPLVGAVGLRLRKMLKRDGETHPPA